MSSLISVPEPNPADEVSDTVALKFCSPFGTAFISGEAISPAFSDTSSAFTFVVASTTPSVGSAPIIIFLFVCFINTLGLLVADILSFSIYFYYIIKKEENQEKKTVKKKEPRKRGFL